MALPRTEHRHAAIRVIAPERSPVHATHARAGMRPQLIPFRVDNRAKKEEAVIPIMMLSLLPGAERHETAHPPIHETPEALQRLLAAERDGQRRQRLQALSLLQTQQARTRLHVARLLGVSRHTGGWRLIRPGAFPRGS